MIKDIINKFNDFVFKSVNELEPYHSTNLKRKYFNKKDIIGVLGTKIGEFGSVQILEDRFMNEKLFYIKIEDENSDEFVYIYEESDFIKQKEKVEKQIKQGKKLKTLVEENLKGKNRVITFEETLGIDLEKGKYTNFFKLIINITFLDTGNKLLGSFIDGTDFSSFIEKDFGIKKTEYIS